MNINQVVYVNLQDRQDRKANILRTLTEQGVPSEIIRPFIATDANRYDTIQELCHAAIVDGYEQRFAPYLDNPPYLQENSVWVGIGDFACIWTKLRLFNELRQTDQTTLILEDDVVLLKTFAEIQELISTVDASILQLDYAEVEGDTPQVSAASPELIDGFGGRGEYALVVNAAGAQTLYDLLLHKDPEDEFHLDQKLAWIETPADDVYAVRNREWVTRRKTKDSDRINATLANWEQHPDVFLADGIPGADWRQTFIEEYRSTSS